MSYTFKGSIAHSHTQCNPRKRVLSPFWAFCRAERPIMPPQAEKRGREGSQAARRQNVPRAPPPERGKAGATVLKPPTTARRVQRVSSLVGVACVIAAPARRRPEITWRARVDLKLWPRPRPFLAHPAAVALLWRPPRRSALAAGATGFCAAGLSSALRGDFARALARCVPPCVLAVGALPLAFRSRERRKPPLLANCARPPAVAPCRWAFLRWRQGLRRSTAASSAPNGFPIRRSSFFRPAKV